jgi:hypothetical protein
MLKRGQRIWQRLAHAIGNLQAQSCRQSFRASLVFPVGVVVPLFLAFADETSPRTG